MDMDAIVFQKAGVPAGREPGLPWPCLVVEVDTVQAVPWLVPSQELEDVQEVPSEVAFHIGSVSAEQKKLHHGNCQLNSEDFPAL